MLTKHYKKVIVAWVLILIISIPGILQMNSVIKYENTGVTAGDYDSIKANEIISQQFQSSVSNGTLIIVLQSDNMTDVPSRNFVLTLQQNVLASTELQYFESVTSVYSVSEMVMTQTVMALGPTLRPAEQQINATAYLLWGIPAMHVSNWVVYHSDPETFNATEAQLLAYLAQKQANQTEIMLTMGYYHAFSNVWNLTASDPNLVANPISRANYCVNAVAPGFIDNLPLSDIEKQMMLAVLGGFDLSTFNDPTYVHMFALNMIGQAAAITNMTFMQEVYDLGPTYDYPVVVSYVDTVIVNGTLYTYPVQVPPEYLNSFISQNGKSMLMMLSFTVAGDYRESDGSRPMYNNVDVLREIIIEEKSATGSTITTYVTGSAAISGDMEESSMKDMQLIEPITIIIIILLMGILFRSVVGQFVPLGAVAIALGISQALVFVIGSTIASVDSSTTTILFAVLMGVGTDYSIFIITRYREERIKGATREKAVHTSVAWAGESIVTSGATVVIAFFAMALTSFSFVQTMGLIIGMAIIVALLVALTLIPALLMLFGNRIFWPTTGERWNRFANNLMQKKREGNHGYFHEAASFAVKHAKAVLIVALLISIPTSYIYVTAEPSFDFISAMGNGESIEGMTAMTDDFGGGLIMPTQVVITGDVPVYVNNSFNPVYYSAVANVTAVIAADPMVQEVTGLSRPFGQPVTMEQLNQMPEKERDLMIQSMMKDVGKNNLCVLVTVVLKEQPESSDSVNFIPDLRGNIATAQAEEPILASSSIYVGGETASLYDLSTSITQQFNNIEIIVMIGIFIVLMIVLGSILLPLFAIVSIAMSIVWAFALVQLIFGTWLGEPILFMIPLILFIMLMGLGMDYNVFILTRIREEVHKGKPTNQAVIDAVDWTGGIITALALIMAGAFGSMMLSSNTMLVMFGFALTVAVLLDAMVVRTYIVPAAMSLMGKWAWWAPGKLQRVGRAEKQKLKENE